MSYVESFEAVMSRARALMPVCDMPLLDKLQESHDAEKKYFGRVEFHRGYRSGIDARDANQWQLDRERQKVVCRLRGFEPYICGKPTEEASKLIRCIIGREDCHVACGNDLEEARDRLIHLLGGKSIDSDTESDAKVIQNGEKYQFDGYDVLGNERHKAVCELRNARDGMSGSMADNVSRIMYAIGAEPKVGERVCKAIADRLIHLLGSDELDLQKSPIFEDSGNNDAGEITITDELRKFATDPLLGYASQELHVERITAIADRIDEQFNRICEQHESVLQQTISDTVDEHEREMAELRQKLSARDMIIDNYHERMKGLDETERRMAFAESKCKELQSKYDNLLVTCKDLTSLANKYFNEVNELFSDETN